MEAATNSEQPLAGRRSKAAVPRNMPLALLKSLRLHHWLKNLLVFVPLALILSHAGSALVTNFVAAFLLLGLLTSGTYLLNDIFDVEADRRHPRKRLRPIASGELPLSIAASASLVLIVSALAGAVYLNLDFAATLQQL
ncbi:MAG TPA: UbiA family prenyltransferase [Methyloceanibacter sp.]|jgi:4-hydroxybenzoate polyprenyltransferase|nr:UbiA family prenyltransferase [Methyloceanibacter sp.]